MYISVSWSLCEFTSNRNFHDLYSPLLFPLKFSLIYADSETNDSEIVILSLERRLENLEKLYFPLQHESWLCSSICPNIPIPNLTNSHPNQEQSIQAKSLLRDARVRIQRTCKFPQNDFARWRRFLEREASCPDLPREEPLLDERERDPRDSRRRRKAPAFTLGPSRAKGRRARMKRQPIKERTELEPTRRSSVDVRAPVLVCMVE